MAESVNYSIFLAQCAAYSFQEADKVSCVQNFTSGLVFLNKSEMFPFYCLKLKINNY